MADAARRSTLVCVNNPSDHRFLVSQGVHDACILRCEDQPSAWLIRTNEVRLSARRALAHVASDLVVPDRTALMVHVGAANWPDLRNVLMSVCDLLDSGALIRMWIIQPQLNYTPVYEFLKDRGWHREIMIFDGFDDLEEIVQAADLGWFSNPFESMQYSLPMFLAAGVPLLVQEAGELPVWMKELLGDVVFGSPTDLALKLHQWYANQVDANQRAMKRRTAYFQHCSENDMARTWKETLDKLTGVPRE